MRIILADDQKEVRSALRVILEQEVEFEIVGEAAELKSLVEQVGKAEPDLILLDCELGYLKVTDIIPILHGLRPEMKIIALSCLPEAFRAALDAGADAFVSKCDHPEILLDRVKAFGNPQR